jgi:hypothetical protein
MTYYRAILDTAFATLSGDSSPTVLSLTFEGHRTEPGVESKALGTFLFPENLLPSNSEHRALSEGESYLDEAIAAANGTTAKCVFAIPPFLANSRLSEEFRKHYRNLGMADAVATAITPDSFVPPRIVALLVPTSQLSSMRSGRWRKEFFPAHSALVIQHDHDFGKELPFPVHHSMRFATVVFSAGPGPVRFFKVSKTTVAEGAERISNDLKRLIRQPAGKTLYGYVHRGLLDEEYPTSFDYYSEETERLRQEVGELGQRVQLGQIADILLSYHPLQPVACRSAGTSEFLTIRPSDITADGRVDLANLNTCSPPSEDRDFLQDGDFCIRRIYRSDGSFVVGVFEGDGRPITWSPNVIVVRPHSSLLPAQRQVLLSFLRSPVAQRLGRAKQHASLSITPHLLREFPVPIADKEIVLALRDLNEARDAFRRWIAEIDEASNAIIQEATASRSRSRILQSGQLARQRFRAGLQVEELDYRVRTQFPHPLAYIWREVQVAGPDLYHRLRAVTKAAEGHTCFLAQVGIVFGKITGNSIAYLQTIATRLSGGSGTNFGDWFAIVKEVSESRALRSVGSGAPFVELRDLTREWESSVRFLMKLRNDDSHGRMAHHHVTPELIAKAEEELQTLYQATEFLTDYRLVLITETRFDSIRRITRYQFRDLSGDNALAPLLADETQRNDLEAGGLYLRDRQGTLHLLRPLLQYLECPECHQMSTFFLDTYDRTSGNMVGIKCFERNTVRREPVADDFRHVGLLR